MALGGPQAHLAHRRSQSSLGHSQPPAITAPPARPTQTDLGSPGPSSPEMDDVPTGWQWHIAAGIRPDRLEGRGPAATARSTGRAAASAGHRSSFESPAARPPRSSCCSTPAPASLRPVRDEIERLVRVLRHELVRSEVSSTRDVGAGRPVSRLANAVANETLRDDVNTGRRRRRRGRCSRC